jgi:enoyl-CoA hydratase/carnithine racemase
MSAPQDILFERRGALAVATLNRPKALNSLTHDMCVAYDRQLAAWAEDESVQAVLLKGAGERAFCAGGDVRVVWRAGKNGEALTADFFRDEYRMNRRIKVFPKPHIAILDGVTMGGGVGISLHGSHRVATERTLIAMPETGIGLFPDVGGTHFLSRLPDGLGLYLGLTGARMKAADARYAGLATDYVPSDRLDELEAALAKDDDIAAAIRGLSADPGPAPLAEHEAAIARCFVQDSLEAVIDALAAEPGDWAAKTLSILRERCSPTSLKVTFEALRRAAKLDFDAAMTMEYRLSQAFMKGHDFYEGIRALLIDKDNAPAWDPASLAEVTPGMVEAHFAPLGDRDLSFD